VNEEAGVFGCCIFSTLLLCVLTAQAWLDRMSGGNRSLGNEEAGVLGVAFSAHFCLHSVVC
jgi:hypothetical protein